jgi:hypothetical protein
MDLTPSELSVLRQLRDLFIEASVRTHQMNMLTSRWPPTHYEAYRGGYVRLLKKGFISATADKRFFTITNAGLRAMA